MNRLGPDELAFAFERKLGDAVTATHKHEREVGTGRAVYVSVWIDLDSAALRAAVEYVCELENRPHFSVISSADLGEEIEVCYHFSLFYGQRKSALALVLRSVLPKDNLVLQTITDLIPGAIFSEREQQEMMGIRVEGIPDDRRLFVSEEFPQDVYPWRRDATGPHEMLRVLGGRQGIQHE